jgi:CNP1-like family
MKRQIVEVMACLASIVLLNVALADQEKPYDFEEKPWVESETKLPEYPKQQNLIEFYVGPTERNKFFVDGSTIDIGADGVVRYVMVLKTSGGATNVTFEALRCATREFKLFAIGRSDATWDKIDVPRWHLIENKTINQYRAVLSRNFLCPAGVLPRDAADARKALMRG